MSDVRNSWERIREWYEANAPSKVFKLTKGANESALKRLEVVLGTELPDDVKEMYRLHDGTAESGIFPFGYYLSSLEQIRSDWERWRESLVKGVFRDMRGQPEGPIQNEWWNTRWIPITGNGGGDHDCVDLDPAGGGVVGQIIEFNHETGARCVTARSFHEFLAKFADALQRGEYQYDDEERSLLPVDG
jgi:cell wall assembly regulator SMI1